MLFVRLLMLLLWPVRLPLILLGRLFRFSRAGRAAGAGADQAGSAAVAGGVKRVLPDVEEIDRRNSVFFVAFSCEESDEPMIGPGDNEVANEMAAKAQLYYKLRPDLFPSDDFYEKVEARLIDQISRIDNQGAEDQFVRMLDRARRRTNDNTRTLYCEIAPIALMLILIWHGVMLVADPFLLLDRDTPLWSIQSVQVFAAELAMAGGALGVALLAVAFIYSLSYTNLQRQNALNLNNFISIEFARLTNMFRVAQRECLQAEAMLSDAQRDEVIKKASAWALTYHWIGVRQFQEELVIRNTMFQVRRNTTLYMALGVLICLLILAITGAFVVLASNVPNAQTSGLMALAHFAAITAVFIPVSYGLLMRAPFAIVASQLRKDEWNRFDTLGIGDAISEQVTRDKVQIIINRDRARAAGV